LEWWLPLAVNGGGWVIGIIILFLALKSGALLTARQHQEIMLARDKHEKYLDEYIDRLEKRNDILDERNDLLARGQSKAIEVAQTAGMVQALPSEAAERLTR
jgi:hypothetical protein